MDTGGDGVEAEEVTHQAETQVWGVILFCCLTLVAVHDPISYRNTLIFNVFPVSTMIS